MRPELHEYFTYKYLWIYLSDKDPDYVVTDEDISFFFELGFIIIEVLSNVMESGFYGTQIKYEN